VKLFIARMRNRWLQARMKGRNISDLARSNLTALDHIDVNKEARSFGYVIVDLETTGLNLKYDQVLSIGAFRVVDSRIRLGDMFNRLVNPGRYLNPESIKVHEIVPDMLSEASPLSVVLDDFLSFLGTDILVAHYAAFDLHFLNTSMRNKYEFPLQNLVLDTIPLCRNIAFPPHHYPYGIDLNSVPSSLDEIAKHFGIDIFQRHTAIGDALATAMILQRVIARSERVGKGKLKDLIKAGALFLS